MRIAVSCLLIVIFISCKKDIDPEEVRYTGRSGKVLIYTSDYTHKDWTLDFGSTIYKAKIPFYLFAPVCDSMTAFETISLPVGSTYRFDVYKEGFAYIFYFKTVYVRVDSDTCYSIDVH